ncbi:hypothetical protein BJ322DRAFT_47716 [Thelephora terrestris]|uniref:AN1-type domain-containing protein n=1 Tax=Thelephora terrestris TaxID=56493 RepID=A0A9P6HR97_9AGAM|nr:hypothetical protein BJ322DRAFT_47716 [Thelephora terrestris]
MTQDKTVLKDIGDHCSHPDCKEFDFLQVKCDKCARVYCKDHILFDLHDCPGSYHTADNDTARDVQRRSRCALERCTKLSLESFTADPTQTELRQPAVCPQCGCSFCIEHRHPNSHDCLRRLAVEAETAKNNKNELARSLLAKHFPTSTSKTASPSSSSQMKPVNTPSSDPKKLALAQKIQAMKMRQRATPGDPKDKTANVSSDQRLHLQVKLEGNDAVSVLWFRKTLIVGRAVDLLATHFKVRPPLQLALAGGNPFLLNSTLGEQTSDGALVVLSSKGNV